MQADLEAAIDSEPDDPSGYEVYADWLLKQGEPRGQLISLQLASWRAPGDKKLARAANQYLAAHRDAMFPFDDDAIDATWHAGFLRAIRFRYDDARGLAGTVRELVRHPSSRFLQSIALPDTKLAPIVKVLLDEELPTLLAELRHREPLPADLAADLHAVFPRLGRGLAPDWRRVLLSIRDERRTDLKYDLAALPALEPMGKIDVADARPEDYARGLKLELEGTRQLGLVAAMRRSFTDASRDRFAIALAEQFFARDTTPTRRWGFDALGAIGDAGAARWICIQLGKWSVPRAQQGLSMLSDLARVTPMGVSALLAIERDTRLPSELRDEARGRVAPIANARGVGLAALAAEVPALEVAPSTEIVRGSRVAWTKGSRTRTGTVFWIGKAKHGDGIRVGLREDVTDETLWANQADCKPI